MTRIPSTSPRLPALRAPALGRLAGAFLVAATLVACGGGGDGQPTAKVTSTSVSATRYAAPALLTINGTDLDNISVSSGGCKNITRLTTAPTVSTSTTAYYGCTVSGAFSSNFVIRSNNATVGTSNTFTVPQPQVTLTVNNTQAVNGNIVIALAGDRVPITVDNFLYYVNTHYYDGQIFDRVVAGFVAQAGLYGPSTDDGVLPPVKPTQPPIKLETDASLLNKTGSVAMARSQTLDSATSEFYVNLADNTNLDGSYAVFGTVTSGMDVMQSIVEAPALCTNNPLAGTIDCLPIPNAVIVTAVQSR
jgi:peptidyl-prolyl cis-trans isomerase A (cyclophilin A)